MDFILDHLLTLITFSPLFAAVVISLLPSQRPRLIKWVALGLSLIPLAFTLVLWFNFEAGGGVLSKIIFKILEEQCRYAKCERCNRSIKLGEQKKTQRRKGSKPQRKKSEKRDE